MQPTLSTLFDPRVSAVHFNSKSAYPHNYLSNFADSPLTFQRRTYATVEHAFQAAKFLPHDPDYAQTIAAASSPAIARRLGKTRAHTISPTWNVDRVAVMRTILARKFVRGSALAALLLETGTAMLIHDAPWDNFWGNGRTGNGANTLGTLLMERRAMLRL